MIFLSTYINPPQLQVYKYPKHTCPLSKEDSRATQKPRGNQEELLKNLQIILLLPEKMMGSKCVILILVVCFLMDHLCAFLLPDRLRVKRSNPRSDQESAYIHELSDLVDLFQGNEGEMTRDWDPNPAQLPAFFSPMEKLTVQLPNNNRHKTKDKRRRIAVPLDPIGSSHLSARNRKEEPEEIKEHDTN